MTESTTTGNRHYWMVATCGIAGWFVVNTVVLILAGYALDPEASRIPLAAYFVSAGVSALAATLLMWKARGPLRGIAGAAVVVTALWGCAAVIVALHRISAR